MTSQPLKPESYHDANFVNNGTHATNDNKVGIMTILEWFSMALIQ